MALIKAVKSFFKAHPIIANGMTYGTMWGFAEFSQQIFTRKLKMDTKKPPEPINKGAILNCVVVGSCVTSNILFFWYKWLDKRFIGSSSKIIVTKLLLDQFVLAPPLVSSFFISMSILECQENVLAEWREKIIPTLKKAWLFWFPAQIINFLLIPSVMRIPYMSCCSFCWTMILCLVKRSNKHLQNNHEETNLYDIKP